MTLSRVIAAFATALFVTAGTALAQTISVQLEWDANSETDVLGYTVFVGTEPGTYTEQHDVGNQTTFVYPATVGVHYYFAVAAYINGPLVGSLSEEVSTADAEPFNAAGGVATASRLATGPPEDGHYVRRVRLQPDTGGFGRVADDQPHRNICPRFTSQVCYAIESVIRVPGALSSVADAGDGRVFAVEGGTRIRVIERDGVIREPALVTGAGVTLNAVRVGADFPYTRFVFVGQVHTRYDSEREFRIVRYREVGGRFGEGAALVTGIVLPLLGDAPFAIDAQGRFYVAVPADGPSSGAPQPYAATLLRFDADGRAAGNSRGASPILARGFVDVRAIEVDTAERLWVWGVVSSLGRTLAYIPAGDAAGREWPAVPVRASADAGAPPALAFAKVYEESAGVLRESLPALDTVEALSQSRSDGLVILVGGAATGDSWLVRLRANR